MAGGANYNGATNSFSNDSDKLYRGTDKPDAQLKTQSTYSDAVNGDGSGGLGWDFDNIWKMPKNGGYPILKWQEE
jgi:hypothetical protein